MKAIDIVLPTPKTVGGLQDRWENNLNAQLIGESHKSRTIEVASNEWELWIFHGGRMPGIVSNLPIVPMPKGF